MVDACVCEREREHVFRFNMARSSSNIGLFGYSIGSEVQDSLQLDVEAVQTLFQNFILGGL